MKRLLAHTLVVMGVLTLLLAVLAAITAAMSLDERLGHGQGLMFADVEIFALLTLFLGIGGSSLLWFGVWVNRRTG
jgi:hypothetical protein